MCNVKENQSSNRLLIHRGQPGVSMFDEVPLGLIFPRILRFSMTVLFHKCYIIISISILSARIKRQTGRGLKTFKNGTAFSDDSD